MATKTLSMSKLLRRYKPRILRKFAEIRQELEENGYVGGAIFDQTDEECSWTLDFRPRDTDPTDKDRGFVVEIAIIESRAQDGEDSFGVNFGMNVSGFEGAIIGGCTPCNYTTDAWVSRKDPEKVEERWELFDHAVAALEIVAVVQRHYRAVEREASRRSDLLVGNPEGFDRRYFSDREVMPRVMAGNSSAAASGTVLELPDELTPRRRIHRQRIAPVPAAAPAVSSAARNQFDTRDGATQTAGSYVTQTAGYRATQTARHRATQTAGDFATQLAACYSTQIAGIRSTQIAGKFSTLSTGNGSMQRAELGSVFVGRWHVAYRLYTAIAQVGYYLGHLKPDVWYRFQDGIWTETSDEEYARWFQNRPTD